ncbi:hypothetical protein BCU68_07765 [Vibrio sp. 10N.286.49.B3]|uniref:tetratricopeptide repeat protein n=1 Tax=Vibrio sp. 10N.286.49.B3 TaxID=1880855 RepID=UPI000C866C88|nr:tetratricopeptide repeat protein [Vibrio sp. 10N.286.49.B3]PMH37502.1 hypothetical protein BCU68_07765 [Vibrio sp. 10N.286.49.B3]
MRWDKILTVLCLWCMAFAINAATYSSTLLNDANNLVEINPTQARDLAQNFIRQRKLSSYNEKNPSATARDDSVSNIRTPSASIDAYMTLAQAEFFLGNTHTAINQLNIASTLANTYQLPHEHIQIKILRAELTWRKNKDAEAAKRKLEALSVELANIETKPQLTRDITYELIMLQGEIASSQNNIEQANEYYAQAKDYINTLFSQNMMIDYHLEVGEFYLTHQQYHHALTDLLFGYWQSIEHNLGSRLAKANRLLAQLFFERRVFDKALEHWSQAADFYDQYENSPLSALVLKSMGDTYFAQHKYNLALVHYFNALDNDSTNHNTASIINIRLNLAATYLHLYNYKLAEQYLKYSLELLQYSYIPRLKGKADLLSAGLAYHTADSHNVINYAHSALTIAEDLNDRAMKIDAYRLLSSGYEQDDNFPRALESMKQYDQLISLEQKELNQISEDAFRQQKEFAEQTLHYLGQEEQLQKITLEYNKVRKVFFALFLIFTITFFILLRRGHILQNQASFIQKLTDDLYTHSRSKMRNLRMLNAKLSNSLQKTNHTFEQWQTGDLIHEPLNDRLRFVMIDLPFLRNMYMRYGYKAGLELEEAFGSHLANKIDEPDRLYHFSDTNLLYIERNADRDESPEVMFNKVQGWINDFEPTKQLNKTIRMGMADYPFLPRAYTAINDKELLDILLMATHLARDVSMKDKNSQWVYFRAIDNAPAASLAKENIREACKQAITQGLIKIQSSTFNEESVKKMLKDE